ncbi:MAG: toll/interleukin-1 receptor domain-containing protein [Atopobiaceae bacterium]|nr:toll/interleukin-1 receptor domain-containing protein [Atopobiaceae bacterium]
MADAKLRCPVCGSEDVAERNGKCVCWDCGHRFDSSASATAPDAGKAEVPMKIFMSYGHTEEEIVSRIKERLEARGHEVWFDQSEIKSGDDWRESIAEGISSSNGVIACLSKHAFRDGGVCHDEIDIAVGVRGGNIKTVLLDPEGEVRPPSVLMHIQWLDMALWREKLAAGPEVFDPWFERCMAELIRVVESRESIQFAGDITEIARKLTVLVDNSRQSDLLAKPFQGRAWLTEQIAEWLDDRTSPRVCLVTGDAGVGKSAFAAHLSHWDSKLTGRIAASVFCVRGRMAYNDAKVVIQTLAYLLACRIPQYRVLLKAALAKGPDLGSIDEASLFSYLIGEPLGHAIDGGHECMAIVIDGIDEAGSVEENALAEVIGSYAESLPAWMKVLVTSRRASAATEPFGGGAYRIEIRGASEENMADIRAHLVARLAPSFCAEPCFDASIDAISGGSGGAFLYAEYMADAVLKGRVTLADAAEQLPEGLGGMFRQWFRWTFPDLEEYRGAYRDALGCILAAPGGSLPIDELPVLFGWSANDVSDFMRRVEVFLLRTEDVLGSPALALNHAVVTQWLASEEAGAFRSDPKAALAIMGKRWHAIAKDDPAKLTDYEAVSVFEALEDAGMTSEADELWGNEAVLKRFRHIIFVLTHENHYSRALAIASRLYDLSCSHAGNRPFLKAGMMQMVGTIYDGLRRFSEAEGYHRGSVSIRRGLVTDDPLFYMPLLAESIFSLGGTLFDLGRFSEAEDAYREAFEIFKAVPNEDPDTSQYKFANCIGRLADAEFGLGRFTEAQSGYREAISMLRALAEKDPEGFLPSVASGLSNLGETLRILGRLAESEECDREALSIHRMLAEDNPAAFLPDLASSLLCLGNTLDELGRLDEAEDCQRESLEILRGLAEEEPTAHLPSIAKQLNNHGSTLVQLGRLDEAEDAYREALSIYDDLAKREPTAYLPEVALSLRGLSIVSSDLGRHEEAEEYVRKALSICRDLSKHEPVVYQDSVATNLSTLGNELSELGREDEAEAAYREALSIRRGLAEKEPAVYMPEVATALYNLGCSLGIMGRYAEEEAAYREAIPMLRELAEDAQPPSLLSLANTLRNLGITLEDLGRHEEGEAPIREALAIFRRLAEDQPAKYLPKVASCIWNLALLLDEVGGQEEAAGLYREAIDIYKSLIERLGDKSWDGLISMLGNYSVILKDLGREDESERAMHVWATLNQWEDPDIQRVLVGIDDYLDGNAGGKGSIT